MMDEDAAVGTLSGRGKLQHLVIAVGIAESGNRPLTHGPVKIDHLACPLVEALKLPELHQITLAVVHGIGRLQRGADHLVRRHTEDAWCPRSKEFRGAPGDDPRPVAMGTKQCQHLHHWLIDAFRVTMVEARVVCADEPAGYEFVKCIGCRFGMGCKYDLPHCTKTAFYQTRHIACQRGLKYFAGYPFRMLRRQRLHPISRENHLGINRLLDPEGSIVIEYGDPR